jgi:hypothetical protein
MNHHEPFYLPESHYLVKEKEIDDGYCSNSFVQNYRNIFYLSPTVPPVDYSQEEPTFLEHPTAAFKYFTEHGVNRPLIVEKKYMGSRGHVLVFRNEDKAREFGFDSQVTIISRSGFMFFREQDYIEKIIADVPEMENDFMILDCEIMPWSLKAKGLIHNSFVVPGECALLDREQTAINLGIDVGEERAKQYLKSLANYTQDQDIQIRVFDLLAWGNIEDGRVKKWNNGYYVVRRKKLDLIDTWFGKHKIFRPVEWQEVDLFDEQSKLNCIKNWEVYCSSGGEGFVFKPPMQYYSSAGYPIQSMVKVRGREYLRIIYGIDYLEPEYLDKLKQRSIKKKRIQAIQETEMAKLILKTFIEKEYNLRYKFIAAFLGVENVNFRNVDKTL